MATGGQTKSVCSLVNVGDLKLGIIAIHDTHQPKSENRSRKIEKVIQKCVGNYDIKLIQIYPASYDPDFSSIVVSGDKIIVADSNECNVQVYRHHDGKLLAASSKLESQPRGICFVSDREICTLLNNSTIQIMLVRCTRDTNCITHVKTLHIKPTIHELHGIVTLRNKVLVFGEKEGILCLCIMSLNDEHTEHIHEICKGYQPFRGANNSHVTAKDDMIYISRYAGFDTSDNGVYAYDVQNFSKHKFIYKHNDLKNPTGIAVDRLGYIFVCNNHPVLPSSIYHLTSTCQLIAIYSVGIPWNLKDIFWYQKSGHLYVTSRMSNTISRYKPVYSDQQGEVGGKKASSLLSRLRLFFGLDRPHKKNADKHSHDNTVPEGLVNEGRQQPASEETSKEIVQGVARLNVMSVSGLKSSDYIHAIHIERTQTLLENVEKRHSKEGIEMHPEVQIPTDLECDEQDLIIPLEILRMDDNSIQLFKEALRDGKEKVYNIRVMVVGQYGVGKTALTKRLIGQQFDILERKSTEGIDVYKHSCKISLDTGEWTVQHEDSDQLFRLQRLVKLLTDKTERSEVYNEQQGLYRSETYPERPHNLVHYSDRNYDDTSTSGEVFFENHSSDSSNSSELDLRVHTYVNQPHRSYFVQVEPRPGPIEKRSDNIQESGGWTTNSNDSTLEFLQLAITKANKLEKKIDNSAALEVWDFAGQYVFYTTHQTFLTCRAIYLLVTDLSQQITDLVEDDECFFDTAGVKLCQVQDLVEVWLNSIHSCTPCSSEGTPNTSRFSVTSPSYANVLTSHRPSTPVASTNVRNPLAPPVILVGTHADKIRKDKSREITDKYFQQICSVLRDKPSLQHLVDYFAIDNTQCDPQLETLRGRILQVASQQPYWGEEIPANWLPLEEDLMKLKASGIKVISHKLVEELNQAAAVPIKTSRKLDLFLRFLHQTGNILFFSVEILRDWIVLDPKWLIDALKSLITAEAFVLSVNPAVRSNWFDFKEKGKLTHELIDAIWTKEKHPELNCYKTIILQLMEKLNIVAKPRFYGPNAETIEVEGYFLAPCMLRQAAPGGILIIGPNSLQRSSSVLCFEFTGRFLPSPVFHRLLAACVDQWPIARQNLDNMIFCGCCIFDLDLHHRLTVLFKEHGIFARVTILGTSENSPSSELCTGVKEFISTTLSNIIGYLGQSLRFELSVQCPKSVRYSVDYLIPVAMLQENANVPCHVHNKSHLIMSRDVLKFWFHEERTSGRVGQIYSPASELTEVGERRLPLPQGRKYHVFFSYANPDMQWVKETVERLERDHGFICREYDRDNTPGTPLLSFAEDSIKYACTTVVVMTKEAFKSSFVIHEIQMALNEGFNEGRHCVVPVLVEECAIPSYLSVLNYVDARNPSQICIWWPKLLTELQTQVLESNHGHQPVSEDISTEVEQDDQHHRKPSSLRTQDLAPVWEESGSLGTKLSAIRWIERSVKQSVRITCGILDICLSV